MLNVNEVNATPDPPVCVAPKSPAAEIVIPVGGTLACTGNTTVPNAAVVATVCPVPITPEPLAPLNAGKYR